MFSIPTNRGLIIVKFDQPRVNPGHQSLSHVKSKHSIATKLSHTYLPTKSEHTITTKSEHIIHYEL
jgi:hypothetical protein